MSGTGGERCRALLAGPADTARPFLQGGMSHGDLHRLAARLYAHFQVRRGEHKGLCLASRKSNRYNFKRIGRKTFSFKSKK